MSSADITADITAQMANTSVDAERQVANSAVDPNQPRSTGGSIANLFSSGSKHGSNAELQNAAAPTADHQSAAQPTSSGSRHNLYTAAAPASSTPAKSGSRADLAADAAPKPHQMAPKPTGSHHNIYAAVARENSKSGSRGDLAALAASPAESPVSPSAPSEGQSRPATGARLMDRKWEDVQKKTFTKWVNTQLFKAKISPVTSMVDDFSDGVKLIQLLEVIGDESIGKYYKAPKLRVQKCENMNKALEFIKQHGVALTNIGAEDLVDKNEKLVLGMIWTIILRWSIAEITEEGLTAKEGLLLWCQRKTHGYKNVSVTNFTFSWQDGLALCALIHRHRPDLLDFDKLNKNNKRENVALAMDIAEKQLNIPKLFDVEDLVDITKPDERSVMTYVAQYFHAFSALGKVEVAGRRVGKFAIAIKAAWDLQNDYERRAGALTRAIGAITQTWSSASFAGNYNDIKNQSNEFLAYKNTQKREWVAEKRDLDTLLGNIQTKLKTYNLAHYQPPAGLALADVDNAWSNLLSAEAHRRKALNEKMQAIKEELRVRYSKLANDFEGEINAISQQLGALDGELQGQQETVNALNARIVALQQNLPVVEAADQECDQAGLDESEREYTVYSVEDLVFDLGLVAASLQKKSAFIQNQIVARQLTNVTPQQLEEFETTFRAFDKNNSNSLSKLEFKACIASLDNAVEDAEFDAVFQKVSGGVETISFEQFTNYMVSITEDRTSPDQLRQSFRAISNGKDYITETDMRVGLLEPEQVDQLKAVLPPYPGVQGAYDFETYLKKVFL